MPLKSIVQTGLTWRQGRRHAPSPAAPDRQGFIVAPSLAEPLTLLGRVIDWFIPPQIAADRDMRQQARMFLMSHLFGPFIGNTVPLALYVVDPSPGYPIAVLAASIFHFGEVSIAEAKRAMAAAGVPVRLTGDAA